MRVNSKSHIFVCGFFMGEIVYVMEMKRTFFSINVIFEQKLPIKRTNN